MHKEQNVVFVLQRAIKHFKINITKSSIKDFLLGHPHYPSMKSVCDALKKWKVEYYPLNLEIDEIRTLNFPFIAHLKTNGGKLAFVKKIEDNFVTYYIDNNKGITESFERFSEKASRAVIILERKKESGEKEYRKNIQNEIIKKSLFPLIVMIVLIGGIYVFCSNSYSSNLLSSKLFWSLVFTKLIGMVASVFLVLHEFKIHTSLSDKLCNLNSSTNCDVVLSSKVSKVFGWINWADIGIIYFISTLIYLLGTNGVSLEVLALMSMLVLPYSVFSIYYQAFKVKKWCPFCLIVQVILISEFLLLIPVFKHFSFEIIDCVRFVVFLFFPAALWFMFRAYYNSVAELNKKHFAFLKFKRNPNVFKYLLQQNIYADIIPEEKNLILGNPEATVTITAFLSFYCNPCAKAFMAIKILLDDCNDVKINAIFSVYKDEESYKLINYMYSLYYKEGSKTVVEFLHNWYSTDKKYRRLLYENKVTNFQMAKEVGKINKKLFKDCNIAGTPTILVQGYKFSNLYDYEDIELYIDEIKQLTKENKKQEEYCC